MTTADGMKRVIADRGRDGDKGTKRLLITPYIGGDFRLRFISTSDETVRATVVLKLDDTPLFADASDDEDQAGVQRESA